MNKENTIIIGFYRLPLNYKYTVYAEDTKTYETEKFEVTCDKLDSTISSLKSMYPNNQVCEFVY